MKFSEFKRYFSIFVLAVAIIAIYKTFDNLAGIFSAVGSFLSILSPIVYAFVIAFLMYPLCSKTEKFIENHGNAFFQKRARGLSVIIIYVFVFLVIGSIVYLILPALVKSIMEFVRMIPQLTGELIDRINETSHIQIDAKSVSKFLDIEHFFRENGWFNMELYTSKIMSISVNFVNIILSVITSIYILTDRRSLYDLANTLLKTFGRRIKFDFLKKYGRKAVDFSYKYLFCVIVDALIIFALSFVILIIMGIDYAPVLALMLGVFNLVPYFGAIIACIIASLITLVTASASKAVILAVVLFALQQIDGNIIQPHLVKDRLEISPFWVIVGILIGGGLCGVWGIILAIPVMALLKTIANDYINYLSEKK